MAFSVPCRLDASYNFVPKELRNSDLYGVYEIGFINKNDHFVPRYMGFAEPSDSSLAAKFRFHGIPHAGSRNYIDEYFDVDARRVQLHFRWLISERPVCSAAQLLSRYGYGIGCRYAWNKVQESEKFWREHFDQCENCRMPTHFDDCIVRLDAALNFCVPDKIGLYTIACLDEEGSNFKTRYVNCTAMRENTTLRSLFVEHVAGRGIPFIEDFVNLSDLSKFYFVWKSTDYALCEMSRHLATSNGGEGTKFPWNTKMEYLDAVRHVHTCKECSEIQGDDKGGCTIS